MQRTCCMFPGKKVGTVAPVGMPLNHIRDSFSTQRVILPCRLGKFLQSSNTHHSQAPMTPAHFLWRNRIPALQIQHFRIQILACIVLFFYTFIYWLSKCIFVLGEGIINKPTWISWTTKTWRTQTSTADPDGSEVLRCLNKPVHGRPSRTSSSCGRRTHLPVLLCIEGLKKNWNCSWDSPNDGERVLYRAGERQRARRP